MDSAFTAATYIQVVSPCKIAIISRPCLLDSYSSSMVPGGFEVAVGQINTLMDIFSPEIWVEYLLS